MRVLIGCSYSGIERDAFRALGHDAWSCDWAEDCETDPRWHIKCDVFELLNEGWDLTIMHPTCTYLANSGVRWLYPTDPEDLFDVQRAKERWDLLRDGAYFFRRLWDACQEAGIPKGVFENPVMHKHGRELIGLGGPTQVVQPNWFGDKASKATCHWRWGGLPDLVPTNRLEKPEKGTPEYKQWNSVWLAPPGPDRWKDRSRAFPGLCAAEAQQWGGPA